MPVKTDFVAETINSLCLKCRKKCKQPAYMVLIKCPHFEAQAIQLEIPLKVPRKSRKPKA